MAQVVEIALVVVHAEQQRPDALAVLRQPVAAHHAVGRAAVLDLHHRTLAGRVGPIGALGDDAVMAHALHLGEPLQRLLGVVGLRGDQDVRAPARRDSFKGLGLA